MSNYLTGVGQTDGIGNNRKGNYLLLRSGQRFWPEDPRPEEFNIKDISYSLSMQCRFSGHCKKYYSVGNHSILVARELARRYGDNRLTLTGLLHDGSETVLVDLPRPIKTLKKLGEDYREMEDKIQKCLAEKYNLIYPFPKEVMEVDSILLITEQRDIMPWPKDEKQWFEGIEPLKNKINPLTISKTRELFLKMFKKLT